MDNADLIDLNKKYGGTFFRILYNEKWETLYAKAIYEEDGKIRITGDMTGEGGVELLTILDNLDFSFPPIGVLNYGNTVVIASKFPARQWKKACCQENYRTMFPLSEMFFNIYSSFGLETFESSLEFRIKDIHQLYTSEYLSLNDAKKELDSKTAFARALNNEFFLTPSITTSGYTLWHMYQPVAELVDSLVIYTDDIMKQEVMDFMRTQHA